MTAGVYVLDGSSIVIENLANQLCKRGVDVTIGALTFKRTPPNGAYSVTTLPLHNVSKLKRFLDGFDIVHNHHPIANYLNLVGRRPFVYHYHGAPNFGRGNIFRCNMFLSVKLLKHRFDAVIAVSESGAIELKRYFNFNNVHVVYNGVDTKRFKLGLDEKFRKGRPQFLFVGNLYEHKMVEELILALKELVKAYSKSHLQIVGEGRTYKRLRRFIAELKLEDNVELVGRVHDCELPYYYASCDVYVTASRWELFGLPLLEAMACGKPIVASAIPPHTELLTKANAGVTYTIRNSDDLWQKMIRVYEEADRYNDNAVAFAKAHNWSIVTERILDIYKQLAPSSGPRRLVDATKKNY
jgi:glycosyltransferase involved in cell wall biosynthesis